ncbi:hypothetical protein GIS00_15930 [Nakamurella sp. YIM 132087]|uniref:Uncharacterized protein n=1 Tax=Nakamurella alba TaxID=2665158 RepID=A0A7K1FMN1_9ACTN|nr:hypothetical protein [Nakamurella alba]MTD15427.1 hypothetical protein [Nakamurella alba]
MFSFIAWSKMNEFVNPVHSGWACGDRPNVANARSGAVCVMAAAGGALTEAGVRLVVDGHPEVQEGRAVNVGLAVVGWLVLILGLWDACRQARGRRFRGRRARRDRSQNTFRDLLVPLGIVLAFNGGRLVLHEPVGMPQWAAALTSIVTVMAVVAITLLGHNLRVGTAD